MDFIFRPLDAEGAKLRKQAQRLASTLPNAKGVANRIERGYILRAVGDGKTVVVTVIPPAASIGAPVMGWVQTGALYPGTTTPELRAVTNTLLTSGSLKGIVLAGSTTTGEIGHPADWKEYYKGGRALVGNVTQQWPLVDYTPDVGQGWVRSPPAYTDVEGQCRFLGEGRVDSYPWTTQPLVHRTGILSLTCPLYRFEHYEGMSALATSRENAVTLVRMNARTPYIRVEDAPPDHPAAIKTDIQADPAVREGGVKGCGLIEFGYDVLGIELAPLIDDPDSVLHINEGWPEPLGAIEWSPDAGVICVRVIARDGGRRLVFLRYRLDVSSGQVVGTSVWRSVFAGAALKIGPVFYMQEFEQQNTGGMWATRAGRGLSDGTPEQPDKLIALSVHGSDYTNAVIRTALLTVDIATGGISTNVISEFDTSTSNLSGPLLRTDYFFAMGITVGTGAAANPALVCIKRLVPYAIFPGVHEGEYYRSPIAEEYSAGDEIGISVINHAGSVVNMDVGANFPACYRPSASFDMGDPGDSKIRLLGLQVLRFFPTTSGVAQYGQPIAEFAPGYIVALVTPISDTFTDWRTKIVVCNVSTGQLVYESGILSLPSMALYDFRGISVARHGVVAVEGGVETITDGGVVLVSVYKVPVMGAPAGGCFVTRDLGTTFSSSIVATQPPATLHYLGDPMTPYVIGGGQ